MAAALALVGCDGVIADPGASPGGSATAGGGGAGGGLGGPGGGPTCDGPGPGRTPVRVLSEVEYENTMRDLLGVDAVDLAVAPGTGAWGFDNDALDLSVSGPVLDAYLSAAGQAAAVVRSQLDARLSCDRAAGAACAAELLQGLGRLAYRRPVGDEELAEVMTLWALGGDFDAGVELAVQGMLTAAPFLYRSELGAPDGAGRHRLDGYEVASRLSYFLWASMPDAALLDAAEGGLLDTADGIRAEAGRMLDDPRARRSVRHLHAQWLDLRRLDGADRDPALHPTFDAELREALKGETLAFVEELVFGGGTVRQLFDADFTMMNQRVAELYGVEGVVGEEYRRVPVDPSERGGLLTQAAFLAGHASYDRTSPIRRGVFVRKEILCQDLPTPPPGIPALPDAEERETERERLSRHRTDPVCASCHTLIDPLGFPFERYDAVGRHRAVDHDGRPVDASGEITFTEDADGPVEDALDLSRRLAESAEVERCVVQQWFRYALGRSDDADACVVRALHEELGPGYGLRALALAIATSDALRYREGFEAASCE